MGITIEKYKAHSSYEKHANKSDNFSTDAAGRLIPHKGEVFETMPLGELAVIAYVNLGKIYQQNPYTTPGMRWEVGFSASRVSFFSPDTDLVLGGMTERAGSATLGFFYYHDLRSLSLGSAREEAGPYISMVFAIQQNHLAQIPVGVRVHGDIQALVAFGTMLSARLCEEYISLSATLGYDTHELEGFFNEVNNFDFIHGEQTDLFISAKANTLKVTRYRPKLFS